MNKDSIIANNDFEQAKEKFENTTPRWKKYWFDCCQQIMAKCKDWAKKYIIDTINMVIVTIGEVIKKIKPKAESVSYTYLIKMYDEFGNWRFTKIGKANNIKKRMNDFKNHEYKRENVIITKTEVIKSYKLPNDDLAQVLESFMRNYFRKNKEENYYPNDRFDAFEPTQQDFDTFEKYYQMTITNAQVILHKVCGLCAFIFC